MATAMHSVEEAALDSRPEIVRETLLETVQEIQTLVALRRRLRFAPRSTIITCLGCAATLLPMSSNRPTARRRSGQKRHCCAIYIYNALFYQDRLGTNIGKTPNKRVAFRIGIILTERAARTLRSCEPPQHTTACSTRTAAARASTKGATLNGRTLSKPSLPRSSIATTRTRGRFSLSETRPRLRSGGGASQATATCHIPTPPAGRSRQRQREQPGRAARSQQEGRLAVGRQAGWI
jgi:hypothetical protein